MDTLIAWFSRHSRFLIVGAACLGVAVAAFSPGLTTAQRISASCLVAITTAGAYAVTLWFLDRLASSAVKVSKVYEYIFFTAGVVGILRFPFMWIGGIEEMGMSTLQRAVWFGGFLSMSLAAMLAASTVLGRAQVLPNTWLERTRDR